MASSDSLLAQVLRTKLIPWTQDGLSERTLIGTSQQLKTHPDAQVTVIPTSLLGPRVVNKGGHQFAGKRWVLARWPKDALNELIQPRLICVLSGRMKFQLNDYFIEANAGHMLVIPSGVPHSNASRTCAAPGSAHCDLLYIIAFPNAIQCWIDRFAPDTNAIEPLGNILLQGEHLATTYRLMVEEIIERGNANSRIASCLMAALLAQIQRAIEENNFIHANHTDQNQFLSLVGEDTTNPENTSFTSVLQNYIYTHIHQTITIDEMAKMMFLSRPQFTRRVRRETGQSFVEFLTNCRITEAKRLLKETPLGIATISESVGIKPSYFSTVFFQHTGITPSQFREQTKT